MSYDPATYWPERYRRQGEAYVAQGGRRSSYDQQIELITPYFDWLPTEGRVLDFGCGPGRFRPELEERGLEYQGVDMIPGLGTMEIEDIEPGSFDCVVALYVLQHIVDEGEYVAAMKAISGGLMPGGTLLAVDAYPREYTEERPRAGHMMPRGPSSVMGWMSRGSVTGLDSGHWVGAFVR